VTIGEGRALKRKNEASKTQWAGDKAAQEWLGMGRLGRLCAVLHEIAPTDLSNIEAAARRGCEQAQWVLAFIDAILARYFRPGWEERRIRELLGEGE
jgi:hypothetical protein